MPQAIDTILAFKTSLAGGGFEDLAAGAGDSFSIRSYQDGSAAYLQEVWAADSASKCQLSIKSPRLHDQVRGILTAFTSHAGGGAAAFNPQPLLPGLLPQRVYSTDTLPVPARGPAADAVAALMQVRYENLGGIHARLASWEEVHANMVNEVGIAVSPVASATIGQWGASVALNSTDNRLKANTDYALLGWTTDLPVTAIAIFGTDTGNLKIGAPGFWDLDDGATWFVEASRRYGVPMIPIINANNAGSTSIQCADVVVSSAPHVTLIFAQLASPPGVLWS